MSGEDAVGSADRRPLALLFSRRFGTFWLASLISNVGTWTQQVAEPWLLLSLGASSFLVGLDSFAMNAPVWLLTLVGGLLADRSDRRRIIASFQSVQMLCPLVIAAMIHDGSIGPWTVIVAALVVGVTDALSMPSFQSIVPTIVARPQVAQGLALNATQFSLSRILGPSLAGVLLARFGAFACFVVSAISYLPFIGVALWILPRRVDDATMDESPRGGLLLGTRVAAATPVVGFALLTVLATGLLCGPLVTFVPVIVKEVFSGGPRELSIAVAAFGVGGLIGGAGLVLLPPGRDRRRVATRFALIHACVLLLAAASPWPWSLPCLLAVGGAAMTVSNTAANSVLQTSADERQLGRSVSLYMLALRGGLALGSVAMGAIVIWLGVRTALLLHGGLAVAAQIAIGRLWCRADSPTASQRPGTLA
jgi:predicted MFS family arabinose efflux permease